jgi:hypothetical protein
MWHSMIPDRLNSLLCPTRGCRQLCDMSFANDAKKRIRMEYLQHCGAYFLNLSPLFPHFPRSDSRHDSFMALLPSDDKYRLLFQV